MLLFFKTAGLAFGAFVAACSPPAPVAVPVLALQRVVPPPSPRLVEVVDLPRPAWHLVATGELPGGSTISEYVPPAETATDWTEMVTTLALPRGEEPAARMTAILDGLQARCRFFRILAESTGAGSNTQLVRCDNPRAASDGALLRQHEAMWFKTLQGRDNFYLVWRAWHGDAVTRDTVLGSAGVRQDWQNWIDQVAIGQVSLAGRAAPS